MIFNTVSSNRKTVRPCDYKNQIHSITSANTTWKATKDCWVMGKIEGANNTAYLYVDNVLPFPIDYNQETAVAFYVKKGSVISTGTGVFRLKVFGCIK